MSTQLTILMVTFSYATIASLLYILTPLMFRVFGWGRSTSNLSVVPLFACFWPLTALGVIVHSVVTKPANLIVTLRDKVEAALVRWEVKRNAKAEEEKQPKALLPAVPAAYKEAFYRDMECRHCGHTINVPR